MAERTIITNYLFSQAGKFLAGSTVTSAPAAFTHLSLDGADMSGLSTASTELAGESTESGLGRTAATVTAATTDCANDTLRLILQFTAGTPDVIYGAGISNSSTAEDATISAFHEWAASVSFETDDKVTETINVQAKTD